MANSDAYCRRLRGRLAARNSPGAIAWRKRVGEVGAVLGVTDTEGIGRKLGPKWTYRLRDTIATASEEDWPSLFTEACAQILHERLCTIGLARAG